MQLHFIHLVCKAYQPLRVSNWYLLFGWQGTLLFVGILLCKNGILKNHFHTDELQPVS